MKKRVLILAICSCIFHFYSYSQVELPKVKNTYLNFLREPSAESQNQLFTFNYQFMYGAFGKTMGANGLIPNFGINLARFFSRKIIIAGVADLKLVPGMWAPNTNKEFLNDFNSNLISTFNNQLDSANASIVSFAFNNGQIFGNNVFNFGIAFSLFPQKYGGILIQVKHGTTGFYLHNVYNSPYVNGGGSDKVPISNSGNWVYELTLKPFAFFKNTYYNIREENFKFANSFIISFYYEKLNFKSAEFNGTTIDKIVSQTFLNKYGIDNRFGFKIGIGLY